MRKVTAEKFQMAIEEGLAVMHRISQAQMISRAKRTKLKREDNWQINWVGSSTRCNCNACRRMRGQPAI